MISPKRKVKLKKPPNQEKCPLKNQWRFGRKRYFLNWILLLLVIRKMKQLSLLLRLWISLMKTTLFQQASLLPLVMY
jgi:hypothetical protein